MRHEERVALITGAAGDIGRAVAHRLAGQGWSLALVDHPDAVVGLEETQQWCTTAGTTTWIDTFDFTDVGEAKRSIRTCRDEVGTPTALFNNAGYQGAFERIDRYPPADAQRVFAVNVLGAFTMLSSVSAAMVDAGVAGSIVCTASMAGVSGAPNMAAYSTSKAAIVGLTKSAATPLTGSRGSRRILELGLFVEHPFVSEDRHHTGLHAPTAPLPRSSAGSSPHERRRGTTSGTSSSPFEDSPLDVRCCSLAWPAPRGAVECPSRCRAG